MLSNVSLGAPSYLLDILWFVPHRGRRMEVDLYASDTKNTKNRNGGNH